MCDDDLERIRNERKARLAAQIDQKKAIQDAQERENNLSEEEKAFRAVLVFLTEDAQQYYVQLQKAKPQTCKILTEKITDMILSGFLRNRRVTLLGIRKFERQAEGREPTIKIKHRGEDEYILGEEHVSK